MAFISSASPASKYFDGSQRSSGDLLTAEFEAGGNDDWPMAQKNPQRTGYFAFDAPDTNETLWIFDVSISGRTFKFCSPVVVDGRVFIGTFGPTLVTGEGNVFYCLNETNGEIIWTFGLGSSVVGAPAVDNGKVYFANFLYDSYLNIYALNETNGKLIWKKKVGDASYYILPDIIVKDNRLYFTNTTHLIVLNQTDGSVIWAKRVRAYYGCNGGPAIDYGIVFVQAGRCYTYAFNETTGDMIWNFTHECFENVHPVVHDGKVYIGTYFDKKVYALNVSTGDMVWNATLGDRIHCSPAVGYGKVFIHAGELTEPKVYAINETSGKIIWVYNTGYRSTSAPVIADGKVFIGTEGCLFALNESNGELVWYYKRGVWGSRLAIANGKLFMASTDGRLYCFGTKTTKIEEVTPCDSYGNPKNKFTKGSLAYFRISLNYSQGPKTESILLTINVYDSNNTTIGIASYQGLITQGTSVFILALPIPKSAHLGNATAYVNAYTDWPHNGGVPYCPEASATFEIVG